MKRSKHIKQKSCIHFNMFPNSLYLLPGLPKTLKRSILSLLVLSLLCAFLLKAKIKWGRKKKSILVKLAYALFCSRILVYTENTGIPKYFF